MIITVDFDGTLSRPDVQTFVQNLLADGHDIYILTSRYDELHRHLYPMNPNNCDMYRIVELLGIPRYKIIFLNMQFKSAYLEHSKVKLHLENDEIEIDSINQETDTIAININSTEWIEITKLVIKELENEN